MSRNNVTGCILHTFKFVKQLLIECGRKDIEIVNSEQVTYSLSMLYILLSAVIKYILISYLSLGEGVLESTEIIIPNS